MVTLKLDIARLLFISVHSHLFSYLEIICHPEIYELRLKRVFFLFKADVRLKIPSKIFRINLRLCVSNQREFLSFLSRGLKSKWSLSIQELYVKIKKNKTSSELNEHVWFVYFDVPEKRCWKWKMAVALSCVRVKTHVKRKTVAIYTFTMICLKSETHIWFRCDACEWNSSQIDSHARRWKRKFRFFLLLLPFVNCSENKIMKQFLTS